MKFIIIALILLAAALNLFILECYKLGENNLPFSESTVIYSHESFCTYLQAGPEADPEASRPEKRKQ